VAAEKAELRAFMGEGKKYTRASFAQESLWFVEQSASGQPLLTIPWFSFEMEGELDIEALETAFLDIVGRHESLRTHFQRVDDVLAQVVTPAAPIRLQTSDLGHLSGAQQAEAIRQTALAAVGAPFDLAAGPLFHVHLVVLGPSHHLLIAPIHHIISDGWSMGVLFRDLYNAYSARASKRPPEWNPLPITYAQYSQGQRCLSDESARSRSLAYWRAALAGCPTRIDFPGIRPARHAGDSSGAEYVFSFPKDLTHRLKSFSNREGVSLFMTLLAGFEALLHRYSAQEQFTVGVGVANRPGPELAGLIGYFVNTLAMSADLSDKPSFRVLLDRVRERSLSAFEHQSLPIEQLVEALKPERMQGAAPLFNVSFVLHNMPKPVLDNNTLRLRRYRVHPGAVQFDLHLAVEQQGKGLNGWIEYRTAVFDREDAARIARLFLTLLESALDSPDTPVTLLPLWPGDAARRCIGRWNATGTPYPRDATVHGLFEAWAERNPDAIAVIDAEREWTYAGIDSLANRLAYRLAEDGLSCGDIAAVDFDRGAALVVALLAVLKSGAAYLPLDRESPPARRIRVVEDAQARIVITNSEDTAQAMSHVAKVLLWDMDTASLASYPADNPCRAVNGGALAYVMYTSGSTGQPKGVCIEHRAIVRLVQQTNYIEISPQDAMAHASTPSFDAATFEIWGALTNGARLIIVPRSAMLEAAALRALLRDKAVSMMFMTTPLFQHYARTHPDIFSSLRVLLFGGETADPAAAATVLKHTPPKELIHVYGPTETTTFATFFPVTEVPEDARGIPIGRPIAQTTAYVLDEGQNPVPPGMPGELYIGGDGVAREYLNHPELTGARFMPDPFGPDSAARMYRTGDLVVQEEDGNISFLGRIDRQVKIRGFRIEPGEVENLLRGHPGVAEAAIVILEDDAGEKYLAAYAAPCASASLHEAELLAFLREQAPSYMIPRVCMVLNRLPVNANGKIDRAALPRPEAATPAPSTHEAPHPGTEEALARLWSELLQVPVTDRHQDFFDSGGHSLLALRMLSRIETAFGLEISPTAFFADTRLCALAAIIDTRHGQGGEARVALEQSLVPIREKGSRPPLFCCWPAGGVTFMYYPLAVHLDEEQPIYGLQDPALDVSIDPYRSIEEMASGCIEAIRRVQPQGPYHLCGWCLGGTIAYEMACQLTAAGETVRRLILIDSHAVFSTEDGSMGWGGAPLRLARYLLIGLSLLPATMRFVADGFGLLAIAPHAGRRRWGDYIRERYAALMLQRIGAVNVASKNDLLRNMELPALRRIFQLYLAHERANRLYRPPQYDGNVDLLRATELHRLFPTRNDPVLGWRPYVKGDIRVYPVEANHSEMLGPRGIGPSAAYLHQLLEDTDT
jgi:amino acid adenylation domain-containing protein